MYQVPDHPDYELYARMRESDAYNAAWEVYYDECDEWTEEIEDCCKTLLILGESLKTSAANANRNGIIRTVDELAALTDRIVGHVEEMPRMPDDET